MGFGLARGWHGHLPHRHRRHESRYGYEGTCTRRVRATTPCEGMDRCSAPVGVCRTAGTRDGPGGGMLPSTTLPIHDHRTNGEEVQLFPPQSGPDGCRSCTTWGTHGDVFFLLGNCVNSLTALSRAARITAFRSGLIHGLITSSACGVIMVGNEAECIRALATPGKLRALLVRPPSVPVDRDQRTAAHVSAAPSSCCIGIRRHSTEQRRQRRLYCGTPGVSRRLWLGAHRVAGSSKAKDNAADQRRTSIRGRRRAPFGLLCTARGRCRWVIGPSRDALKVEEA
jgi:hypothetical protein